MVDILHHAGNSPGADNSSGEGSIGPNTQHSGTPNPEQDVAVSSYSPDTRDGYVNTQNHAGASTEHVISHLISTPEDGRPDENKSVIRRRLLATTAIAASVIIITGGIWLSTQAKRTTTEPLQQPLVTTTMPASATMTSSKPYIAPEFLPPKSSTTTITTTTTEKDPNIVDRTQELSILSNADSEKVRQYKALPHSFSIADEQAQQELISHSCKGLDLWLRTNNDGNIADQIVGGGNTHSKAEVKQAFETFWAQTRAFLGREFGQEGLPILSCEGSWQVKKTNFNCNNSTVWGTQQNVVMNIAYVTPYGTPDNRVPVVQLHFKNLSYCPAFNRNYGEKPTEAGVVVVYWTLPEVRMGTAIVDTATWELGATKFDATTVQGKWQAPTEANSFYEKMKSN